MYKSTILPLAKQDIKEDAYAVPEWQKKIVRERIKNTRSEEYLSWDEVQQKLNFIT